MKQTAALILALVLAGPATAQVADQKVAEKLLFSTRGYALQYSPSLSASDKALVKGIIPLMAEQLRQPVRYYAAIAWSPDDGMVHEALQAAMNYHSVAAADRAAVDACNQLKSKGAQSCQLAVRVLPKGYRTRPLTLSVDATAGFNSIYKKEKSPKSFAISPATGSWGMGKSDNSALQVCEKQAKIRDCKIVIRN